VAVGNPHLRVNPGGRLSPVEVVGCDAFIAAMWDSLTRQSVVLEAERRMGKTSVLRKMAAEPAIGTCPIKRSLQGFHSPEEFVRGLIADTERVLPGVLKRSLGSRLRKAGVRRLGVSVVSVEFEPASEQSWKDVATDAIAVLDREPNVSIVLLWDELPHMVANIRDRRGPLVARELLDHLRGLRETHERARMVFCGSVGLHHVVRELRTSGSMWVPTHDMLVMDLPPLGEDDAIQLARDLLRNEGVRCDDVESVAVEIASETDRVPYYIHHTIKELINRQGVRQADGADADLVRTVVSESLADPLDPWQLQHYIDRIENYYDGDAAVVKAILDVVARASAPPTIETIHARLGAELVPPSREGIRELLVLLCKDHYLGAGPNFSFRLDLLGRVWRARRP
jgi:hypothetical protein